MHIDTAGIEEMNAPTEYKIQLCFVFGDLDSCIEFEITVDGEVEDKAHIVQELIYAWDGIVEMEDGSIVNLKEFKQAFVFKADTDAAADKPRKGLRIV
jgi:hypothetical protein